MRRGRRRGGEVGVQGMVDGAGGKDSRFTEADQGLGFKMQVCLTSMSVAFGGSQEHGQGQDVY